MRNRCIEGARPFEAKITIARLHRKARDRHRLHSRTMAVELRLAETVRESVPLLDDLGAEHSAVERVRSSPIRYVDHAVIEFDGVLQWVRPIHRDALLGLNPS